MIKVTVLFREGTFQFYPLLFYKRRQLQDRNVQLGSGDSSYHDLDPFLGPCEPTWSLSRLETQNGRRASNEFGAMYGNPCAASCQCSAVITSHVRNSLLIRCGTACIRTLVQPRNVLPD